VTAHTHRVLTEGCYRCELNKDEINDWITEHPWVIIQDGEIIDRFATSQEAYEATYTGEYPDDVEVALMNEVIA
jgi:hypothetical protein